MSETTEKAREMYRELGVDVDAALDILKKQALSIHCWQGDDVGGFERAGAELEGGGIQVTGNYHGKARNLAELRADLEKAYSLIPGRHRLNLHASYGDFGGEFVDRDKIEPKHFDSWIEWGAKHGIHIDFNATLFSHTKADEGFTLSSKDPEIRNFWIEHVKRARKIAAYIGEKQGSPCIHNIWIPDGSKDIPVDRYGHRKILVESLDEIMGLDLSKDQVRDAVESKLFGIGSESFVVGSHEFYLGYSLTRNTLLCLDMGHFHLTESVADKISSFFQFQDELLLHVSRPVRWDSDHVVILNDDLRALMEELVRSDALGKTHIGLDFFDATINRIGAYALGSRSALKGLLAALLEPRKLLKDYDEAGNYFARLALLEEAKLLPMGAVWDEYCRAAGVPTDRELIDEVMKYEHDVLSRRD
jgi:L-rhamnose isomerase